MTVEQKASLAGAVSVDPESCTAHLLQNRAEISAKIDEGYAAAQRGELIDGDQVREQMAQQKRAWLSNRNRSA